MTIPCQSIYKCSIRHFHKTIRGTPMTAMPSTRDVPPFKPLPMLPPKTSREKRKDGSWIIKSLYPMGEMNRSIAHLFEQRASEHPERKFICQRVVGPDLKTGAWRHITYGEANQKASQI